MHLLDASLNPLFGVVMAQRIHINFFDDTSDGHGCRLICDAMLGAGGGR
jgi:hypothetical protein